MPAYPPPPPPPPPPPSLPCPPVHTCPERRRVRRQQLNHRLLAVLGRLGRRQPQAAAQVGAPRLRGQGGLSEGHEPKARCGGAAGGQRRCRGTWRQGRGSQWRPGDGWRLMGADCWPGGSAAGPASCEHLTCRHAGQTPQGSRGGAQSGSASRRAVTSASRASAALRGAALALFAACMRG